VQAVGQEAANEQQAASSSTALQEAINAFMPLAVLSPGPGEAASQQNNASSSSGAGNANGTTQAAGQTQAALASCGGEQAVGQSVSNQQAANSGALAMQAGAANISAPVQVLSSGDAGAVSQENNVSASSTAQNTNETVQAAGQTQVGSGSGTQAIGQTAQNVQAANSAAVAMQGEALNLSAPVAVLSGGAVGSVVQGNAVNAASLAGNANSLIQASGQTQGG
jgi:hypothetical protein